MQREITLIVLTKNEEPNLSQCLESMRDQRCEIFVVDSGSEDRTVEIANSYGARVFSHEFETHSKQWKWALENLPINTDWVLGLDADQRATPELRDEVFEFISGLGASEREISGAYIKRRQVFRGRWIRHGGYYPKYLLKLFRVGAVSVDPGDLVDHHFRVDGRTVKFNNDIIEDNQNEADISVWIAKHNRYARLQAEEDYKKQTARKTTISKGSFFGSPDERVLRLKRLWNRMPLFVRPFLYFIYRYFFRLGFLDGKQGFIFHFLQAFWYRLLVDINLDQLRLRQKSSLASHAERSSQDTVGMNRDATDRAEARVG